MSAHAARAARDVPPGASWAFREHRKMSDFDVSPMMTPEQIRTAINRLASKIVNETGGQSVCDKLELELSRLEAMLEALSPSEPIRVSRGAG